MSKRQRRRGRVIANARLARRLHRAGQVPPYEKLLTDFYTALLKPQSVAVDVGAHHGLHFDRLAHLAGKAIAFEPVPDFVDIVRGKHGPAADIRTKALADKPGRTSFLYMTAAPGESGFRERRTPVERGAKSIEVEVSTLDAELGHLNKLTFIKLDTEGAELSILAGGAATIRRLRPFISIEYQEINYSLYGNVRDSLYDWALAEDYRIADLFGSIVRSREEWHSVCDVSYWDFLLFPAEKRKRFVRTFRSLDR